ncbi:MAG: MoxR family ATPase, partial [Candidatus Omnitrophota bacterium]|nr:MoxR family ATPase [Candidatus Omnitrophota bacterium]
TQNPIESEGTYPLPEAQVDRFMFKVVITYPSMHEEITVVERMTVEHPDVSPVLHVDELLELQRVADAVYVHPKIMEYAVTLANATRRPKDYGLPELSQFVAFGSSPRASLNLIVGGKALALLRGREFVLPEDVRDLAPEVMRHRFVLSYEALAQDMTSDVILSRILAAVPAPRVHIGDPYEREKAAGRTVAPS